MVEDDSKKSILSADGDGGLGKTECRGSQGRGVSTPGSCEMNDGGF